MRRTSNLSATIKPWIDNPKLSVNVVIYIVGVVMGCLAIKLGLFPSALSRVIQENTQIDYSQPSYQIFFSDLNRDLLYFFVSFFFALSPVGAPFICGLAMLKGISIGTICGYIYYFYGLSGLVYNIAVLLPSTFLSVFAVLMLCGESLKLSTRLFRMLFLKQKENDFSLQVKLYSFKVIGSFIFLLVSALILVLCAKLFGKYFAFPEVLI